MKNLPKEMSEIDLQKKDAKEESKGEVSKEDSDEGEDKKKKKKKKILDLEPASIKKQIRLAGKSNVSTRSKNGGTDSESGADLTSYDGGDAVSIDLS